jgi:hypothetical protein
MTKIIIIIILLQVQIYSQDFLTHTKKQIIGKHIYITIKLVNLSTNTKYLQTTYWEVYGTIDSSDILFGYPDDDCKINRIEFYPKNSIFRYNGEKHNYPKYKHLPKFIEILPQDTLNLNIELSKIFSKAIDIKSFSFNILLLYINQNKYDLLKNHFNIKKDEILLEKAFTQKEVNIPIFNESVPYKWLTSDISVPISEQQYIRDLLDKQLIIKIE